MDIEELVETVLRLKGKKSQYLALAEEAAELIVASNHKRRGKTTRKHFLEEMVDVVIMIDEFRIIEKITDKEFNKMYEKKLNKFRKQVEEMIHESETEIK